MTAQGWADENAFDVCFLLTVRDGGEFLVNSDSLGLLSKTIKYQGA